jgi:hypothetical protein
VDLQEAAKSPSSHPLAKKAALFKPDQKAEELVPLLPTSCVHTMQVISAINALKQGTTVILNLNGVKG